MILPQLKFRAGKKPQAVRTAAAAALWALLSSGACSCGKVGKTAEAVRRPMARLAEDARSEKVPEKEIKFFDWKKCFQESKVKLS